MKKALLILLVCALSAVFLCIASAEGIGIQQDEMHEVYEADGTALAKLDATFPQLTGMEDKAGMESVNAAIRDAILSEGGYTQACEYALDDYTNASELFAENEYGLDAIVQAELLWDDTLLAVRYDFVFSSGGPHPWDTVMVKHFDLSAGMPVALETLAREPAALLDLVSAEALRWIGDSGFEAFDEAGERALEWPFTDGLLTANGLLVFFNEGVLGPVSEGTAEFLIPYEKLTDILESVLVSADPEPTAEIIPDIDASNTTSDNDSSATLF